MRKYGKQLFTAAVILLVVLFLYQVCSIFTLFFSGSDKTVGRGLGGKEAVAGDQEVIRKGADGCKKLTFTCNVDWGEDVIPQMLDIFKKENIKITFFVTGRWAKEHPDLLKEMYGQGHEIQSHGYGHKLCSQVSTETTREEIQKTEAVIQDIIGVKTTVFAPPSGDFNESTVQLCKELGYKLVLWSSDTIDWRPGSTADIIKQRILNKPLDGAIVLMHPKEETVKALPSLIQEIKKQGIEIVPFYKLPL